MFDGGNFKSPTRVWLSEAFRRRRNYVETPDEQICNSWRGRNSVDGDRTSATRTSSYPGARRIRLFLSQWGFGNWIHTISTTRGSCCRSWNSRRYGVSTICSYTGGRIRNHNQTLVSAGRPPPAACSRCSGIGVRISAKPRSRRRRGRPQDQKRLPRMLNAANLGCCYQTLSHDH